ncbi:MAG: HAD-IA family hydrolase [Ramlibacter sp.]|nr:HAD-IA family hydrolase [Ramlibacter sp.]
MDKLIRAVVFDFEGTLVDFQWRLVPAEAELRRAFAEQGYPVEGNYAQMWNTAADRAAAQGRLEALRRALFPIYDRWDADALTRWSLRSGASALLQRLADRQVGSAMVSNVGRAALDAALGRFGIQRMLWPVLGRDDVMHLKPDPEGVSAVLATMKVPAQEALFVGDSLADVRAARAVGMRVAIIHGGESQGPAFAAAPPDWMVSQLDEIADLTA